LLSGGVRRWLARVGLLMAPAETCERSTCSKCLNGVGGGGVMGREMSEGMREREKMKHQGVESTPGCLGVNPGILGNFALNSS